MKIEIKFDELLALVLATAFLSGSYLIIISFAHTINSDILHTNLLWGVIPIVFIFFLLKNCIIISKNSSQNKKKLIKWK